MSRTKKPEQNYRAQGSFLAQDVKIKPVTLSLPPAHPKQYEFISSFDRDPNLRFLVGAMGSKTGKTYGCTIKIVQEAWNNKNSINWWCSPSYAQSKLAYALIKRLLPLGTYHEAKADLTLYILSPDGGEHSSIVFKSGDNEDSLRGFAVNFFVIDEAARMKYESFVSMMTTVTQTQGKGIIISTPKGRGWFYDAYQRGNKYDEETGELLIDPKDDPYPEWLSKRLPTWVNPHVELKAIEQMRQTLPEDVYKQEICAQFLLESAGVFRGVDACVVPGTLQEPQPGHHYVMGCDLARLRDYSVLTVIDKNTNTVVAFDRFNQISWDVQYHRIINLARKYRAQVVMDSTGIGDPIVQTIQNAGVRVEPYKIGGSLSKQQLIDKLRVNIENQRIHFPNIPLMLRELKNYEYKVSESAVVKFSAPSGQHDDCVISLALANWGADQAPWIYRYSNQRGI